MITRANISAVRASRVRRLIFVPDAALIPGLRLIEGGAYSSKYGIAIGFKESKCLQLPNPS